ncbi:MULTISPECIES: hypothetical protein [Enterobacteriaceae]|uniref:hypothetical protein n=1 Tax=Enterobacteriaceae TaxID=543 RepID=UPI0007751869|nr:MULTISPECIES: hypothetical protein [Enterobacteriaceae]MCE6964959.1 hypothetical protein [Enterobacter sp. MW07]EEW3262221.1 hypothetical protein [Escherichia coli]EFJ2067218.1 hypothetical protein [Escherichia coli]EFK5480769.1 hypothetical protein [Escherichia coli]KXP43482.1 hypothetical protein AUQ30_21005 [Escherichia coli]
MNYKFEESIANEMPLPDSTTAVYAMQGAYAVLARTLNDEMPGFAEKLLANLDRYYAQNEGQAAAQLAIAQIGVMVKTLTSGQK